MRLAYIFCLMFVSASVFSFEVFAAEAGRDTIEDIQKRTMKAFNERMLANRAQSVVSNTQLYQATLEEILRKPFKAGDHALTLRDRYAFSRQYVPFSEKIVEKLTHYAYVMDTSDDLQAKTQAQGLYRDLLYKHLGNFGVVAFALDMSSLDVRYGNEVMLRRIYKAFVTGLKDQIRLARGANPDHAFQVVTYGEEEFLLEQVGGVVDKSEIYKVSARQYFNVHDLTQSNGEYRQVFVDVTIPILQRLVINYLIEKEKAVSIPAQ